MKKSASVTLAIFGFPVSFSGPVPSRLLRAMLGTLAARPTKAEPALRVEFIANVRGLRRKGFHPESTTLLLGHGFGLDYKNRLAYVARDAPRTIDVAENQPPHFLLPRTVLFCLALLSEMEGSGSLAKSGSALYMHASSVLTRKGALLFCGDSTFGKSTISGKVLTAFPKLEDDAAIILLSAKEGAIPRIALFGGPLQATSGFRANSKLRASTHPVAGLFWLKKSQRMALQKMDSAEALSLNMSLMFHWNHPPAVINRLRLLKRVVTSVPCNRLEFFREAVPLIRLLREHGFI